MQPSQAVPVPLPVLVVLRGIGQIVFQDNAITGALFVLGIALSLPLQAAGIVAGALIGTATAWLLQFNPEERDAGIWGFNPALVGIATLFFFQPGVLSLLLLVVGCVAATLLTWAMRKHVPFPTYTTPFIVVTWVIFLVGRALGAEGASADAQALVDNPKFISYAVESTLHGVGQIMFQGSFWTGLCFIVGIAISNARHAGWVLLGSFVGMLMASYHVTAGLNSIDPERLIEKPLFDNIKLGLYGYNATLAPVALYLWRRSLIAPLLGMIISVPITEFFPQTGLPALTAPFVLATWIVLGLYWLEARFFSDSKSSS
ncbi:MAG: urea transporter [Gemmataceae bacterium]